MKTKNIGFWAVAAVMANLLAAPIANSQTERFSASLGGGNEVASNQYCRHRGLRNDDPGPYHLFVNVLRPVIAPNCGSPALRAQQGRWGRHDIPVRRREPASLPGGD
jgi:hypothetical protein